MPKGVGSWRGSLPRLPSPRPAAREGAVDGLNLFFGALLGANLGTLDHIRLVEYVQLIGLLAGTVIATRMMSAAGGRLILVLLAVYSALLVALVAVPGFAPSGLKRADLYRLVATLAMWVALTLAIEFARLRREIRQG